MEDTGCLEKLKNIVGWLKIDHPFGVSLFVGFLGRGG